MSNFVNVSLASFAVVLAACVTPVVSDPTASEPRTLGEYHIAPPDQLRVAVQSDPEIVRELVVRPDGRISLELIGDVEVEGRTIAEVEAELRKRLGEYIVRPEVSVSLEQSNSRKFFVFGEVSRPGAYPLVGRVTVLHALGAAGGPTRFAALSTARLVRPTPENGQVFAVNLSAISQAGLADTNYVLQPGDVIYVPPNGFAQVGHVLGIIFYPLQQIIGLGASAATTVVTGGL